LKESTEIIYVNGNVITMDKECPRADYIIVRDGVIQETGKAKKSNRFKNTASIVDLGGKTVLPGFTDCHMHLVSYSHRKEREADLTGARSADELIERVKRFIAEKDLKPGEWVVGAGWNNEDFPDRMLPDKKMLDLISAVHPIKLTRACYHLHSVNSLALNLAGIGRDTSDVYGGKIDRDAGGFPTGILMENAIGPVNDCIPGIRGKGLLKSLIVKGCTDLAEAGITTVHTDDFSYTQDKKSLLEAYYELDRENALPIRAVLQMRITRPGDIDAFTALGIRPGKTLGRLTYGAIKIVADGSLGAGTAALTEPYSDRPGNRGMFTFEEHYLEEMIAKAFERGFDAAVHAIGDRAYETVLNLFGKYRNIIEDKGLRPSIIHCQIGSKRILDKMKDLDITANIQPVFINSDWKMAESRIGKERLEYSYCWQKYMDMGIRCVGSSDAPIEPFAPLYGIYSAVTRKDLEGRPAGGWLTEQKLTPGQALRLFTVNPPYLTRQENCLGSISRGKLADMIVLSEDIFTMPHERIKEIEVISTIVGGQAV
jgi:hypothetical protein